MSEQERVPETLDDIADNVRALRESVESAATVPRDVDKSMLVCLRELGAVLRECLGALRGILDRQAAMHDESTRALRELAKNDADRLHDQLSRGMDAPAAHANVPRMDALTETPLANPGAVRVDESAHADTGHAAANEYHAPVDAPAILSEEEVAGLSRELVEAKRIALAGEEGSEVAAVRAFELTRRIDAACRARAARPRDPNAGQTFESGGRGVPGARPPRNPHAGTEGAGG